MGVFGRCNSGKGRGLCVWLWGDNCWLKGTNMKVLIVGGGIAGLTLAGLLQRRPGMEIVLVERAERFEELGGFAIGLYPMGSRVMHGLGVFDEFVKRSREMKGYEVHDDAGKLVRRFDWEKVGEQYGQTRLIARSELVNVLHGGVGDGVDVRMGRTVETIDEKENMVGVKFDDGVEEVFDLVVGADGLHSKVRQICFKKGESFDPEWGGWVWWMDLNEKGKHGDIVENWGRGRFLGFYPTDRRMCIAVFGPNQEIEIHGDGRKEKVKRYLGGLGAAYEGVMDAFPEDEDEVVYWRLKDCWSRKWHTKRVVLVGDSGSAVLPTAGAGASMAMESAAVLADELLRVDEVCVERALMLYEKRRKRQVKKVVDQSRSIAGMMIKTTDWAMRMRFLKMRVLPRRLMTRMVVKGLREPI
ncbi:FAD-dependent monooxygenase [Planctomycetota bacterium]|nr:FAD-dependent monooxygenase [Planctomycetota bacterium]